MDTSGHTSLCEDYVSFESAKLLKEKGFDENTPVNYFVGDDKLRGCVVGVMIYHKRAEGDTHLIACPTLSMAMKWLREVHKIEVRVIYDNNKSSWYGACNPMRESSQILLGFGHKSKSYEEAAEAAIKYCCENLI